MLPRAVTRVGLLGTFDSPSRGLDSTGLYYLASIVAVAVCQQYIKRRYNTIQFAHLPYLLQNDLFVLFSVHATLSILLQIHILQASIFLSIALVFIYISHPYRTAGNTKSRILL